MPMSLVKSRGYPSRGRLAIYVTETSALRLPGWGQAVHIGCSRRLPSDMLGPRAVVRRVHAGLGVGGLIATVDY
jgi:hypothetical protein